MSKGVFNLEYIEQPFQLNLSRLLITLPQLLDLSYGLYVMLKSPSINPTTIVGGKESTITS